MKSRMSRLVRGFRVGSRAHADPRRKNWSGGSVCHMSDAARSDAKKNSLWAQLWLNGDMLSMSCRSSRVRRRIVGPAVAARQARSDDARISAVMLVIGNRR